VGKFEGASPLQNPYFPLSFEGEGDKGGEVTKLKNKGLKGNLRGAKPLFRKSSPSP